MEQVFVTGSIDTAAGPVALVSHVFSRSDRLGAWKSRWGIGRMALYR